jgi:hypothetical protein
MTYRARIGTLIFCAMLVTALSADLWAQEPAAKPDAAPAAEKAAAKPAEKPAAAKPIAAPEEPGGPYRKLAPGVMKRVDSAVDRDECFSWHDIVELVALDPSYDWAKQIGFHRDVWHLNFEFKPIRMIQVDVPQPSGKMRRELIKYMIYKVTNPGKMLHAEQAEDGTWDYKEVPMEQPIRFIPNFLIEAPSLRLEYPDRVIPVALGPIRMREDPNRRFYTSPEMAAMEIKPNQTVWGVAMWEDLNPRIDYFSVIVQGLTNAYHWKDEPGKYQKGMPLGVGRTLSRKSLKINFWRAGDEYYEREKEIHYPAPGQVDYEWVYR